MNKITYSIVEKQSLDRPSKKYYIIVCILANGLAFNLQGIFSTQKGAEEALKKETNQGDETR